MSETWKTLQKNSGTHNFTKSKVNVSENIITPLLQADNITIDDASINNASVESLDVETINGIFGSSNNELLIRSNTIFLHSKDGTGETIPLNISIQANRAALGYGNKDGYLYSYFGSNVDGKNLILYTRGSEPVEDAPLFSRSLVIDTEGNIAVHADNANPPGSSGVNDFFVNGNMEISGNLIVEDIDIENLTVVNDADISGNLNVENDVGISGNLIISNPTENWNIHSYFSGNNVNVLETKPSYVGGVSLYTILNQNNEAIFDVRADTTLNNSNVDVKSDFFVREDSRIFGDFFVNGVTDLSGALNAKEIIVSKDVSSIARNTFYRMNVTNSSHSPPLGIKQLELDYYEEADGDIPENRYAIRIGGSGGLAPLIISFDGAAPVMQFEKENLQMYKPLDISSSVKIREQLDMSMNRIINVENPSNNQDVATKLYVDNKEFTKEIPYLYNVYSNNNDADVTSISGLDSGTFKWEGGVLAPNGKIYCIPRNSEEILKIDPLTNTTTTFGTLPGTNKWCGGVLAPNGKIYCVPHDATTVLIIDPETDTTTSINGPFTGTEKWFGGVLAPNGKIYCVPHNATTVLIIDPKTDTAENTTITGISNTTKKYIGGVLALNEKIYCVTYNGSRILIINTKDNTYTEPSNSNLSDTNRWFGGVLAQNNKIYCMPFESTVCLIIDPSGDTINITDITELNPNSDVNMQKWSGSTLAENGKIYGIPYNSSKILEIDPETNTAEMYENVGTGAGFNNKWQGCVLAPNNNIYGVPCDSTTSLIIKPRGLPKLPQWMLSAYYNKL